MGIFVKENSKWCAFAHFDFIHFNKLLIPSKLLIPRNIKCLPRVFFIYFLFFRNIWECWYMPLIAASHENELVIYCFFQGNMWWRNCMETEQRLKVWQKKKAREKERIFSARLSSCQPYPQFKNPELLNLCC